MAEIEGLVRALREGDDAAKAAAAGALCDLAYDEEAWSVSTSARGSLGPPPSQGAHQSPAAAMAR